MSVSPRRALRKKQLIIGSVMAVLLACLWWVGWSMELVQATSDRDAARVARALTFGADPNFRTPGDTPVLLVAVWVSDTAPEIAGLIVNAGADPNRQGWPEHTPLMAAVAFDRYDLAVTLLKARKLTPVNREQLRELYDSADSERMKSLLKETLGPSPP
jgi:ankyrin repeat protein